VSPRPPLESSRKEEWANALTHGFGLLASVIGGILLLTLAVGSADAWRVASTAIFATTLVLLYTASTLYHAVQSGHLKGRLKLLDHSAIYLLIAGSYTPFTLVGLRGGWGWSLFGVVWALALVGVVFKLLYVGRFQFLSTATYVGMGWLALVAIHPMRLHLGDVTLAWIVAGGIFYTAGTLFYHNRRIPYHHAIWHLFVMGGSLCHGIAVATQLLS
jgi:hemolysin III